MLGLEAVGPILEVRVPLHDVPHLVLHATLHGLGALHLLLALTEVRLRGSTELRGGLRLLLPHFHRKQLDQAPYLVLLSLP